MSPPNRITANVPVEDLYRQMFRTNSAVKLLIDPSDGSIVDANPAAEEFYGYPPGRLTTLKIGDINMLPPAEVAREMEAAQDERRSYFKFSHRLASGQVRDVEVHSSPVAFDGRTLLYSIIHDVTGQKNLERALRESEGRYRLLAEHSNDLIILVDTAGNWLYASPSHKAILGYDTGELTGHCVFDWIHPEDLARQQEIFQGRIDSRQARTVEVRLRHKDGHWVWIESVGAPVTGPDGRVDRVIATGREITQRRRAEATLREAEEKYRSLVEGSLIGVYVIQNGIFVYVNPKFAEIFGYEPEEINGKKPFVDLVAPMDRERVTENIRRRMDGEIKNVRYVFHALSKDGNTIVVEVYGAQTLYNGAPAVIGSLLDITERKRAENIQAALYRIAEETSAAGDLENLFAAVHRIVGELMDARNFYVALLDAAGEQLSFPYLVDEWDTVPDPRPLRRGLTEYVLRTGASLLATPDVFNQLLASGQIESVGAPGVDWLGVPLRSSSGPIGVIAIQSYSEKTRYTDSDRELLEFVAKQAVGVIEAKRAEERIRYLAFHDPLTELPNRLLFNDRLKLAVAQAHRSREGLAVMFADLDRFKVINDSLGHSVGDGLLKAVAKRLQERLREGDTLARLGGDEFILLLPEISNVTDAMRTAQKILGCFKSPFEAGGQELFTTCSIGVSLYPVDGLDAESLVRNADIAMYRAKERGRDNYQLYTAELQGRAQSRMALENSLRAAIQREEFTLLYQPQFDIASGEILALEALVYWQREAGVLTPPGEFIPAAEETGLILPLGSWVLRTACAQARAWMDEGFSPVRIAVNLSARQFQQPDLVEQVAANLRQARLPGELLELEITESTAMINIEQVIATIRNLKALGARVTMDDFGTGFCSLEYLKNFPFDNIKIDRAFIRDMIDDPRDAAVVRAAIALGHGLGLRVIAEGVETEEQRSFLSLLHCDSFQGFLAARPVPAEETARLLAARA